MRGNALGCHGVRYLDGNARENRGAAARRALDLESPAKQLHPLPDTQQTETALGHRESVPPPCRQVRVQSAPVVLDDGVDMTVSALDDNARSRRPTVLGDVGQCFLHDTI